MIMELLFVVKVPPFTRADTRIVSAREAST